jgi:transposase-like protein
MTQETSMALQNATPAVFAFARYFTRPHCPECAHEQFVPEHSSFVDESQVRHGWLCDSCGNKFCTTVEIGRRAA